VWSADFVSDALYNGVRFLTFNMLDDFNSEALRIEIDTWLSRNLDEVRELTWAWMLEYNEERDHDGLGGLTPAEALENARTSTF